MSIVYEMCVSKSNCTIYEFYSIWKCSLEILSSLMQLPIANDQQKSIPSYAWFSKLTREQSYLQIQQSWRSKPRNLTSFTIYTHTDRLLDAYNNYIAQEPCSNVKTWYNVFKHACTFGYPPQGITLFGNGNDIPILYTIVRAIFNHMNHI